MDRTLFRRFIRRHFVALPLCILALAGAIVVAVLASSGATSASDKRAMAGVVTAWQRAETLRCCVPAALVPQVERLWTAKSASTSQGSSSGVSAGAHVALSAALGDQIIKEYEAAKARVCTPAFAYIPLTERQRRFLLTTLKQELDLRGSAPLTRVSFAVASVSDVGQTGIGPVVRVKATTVETDAAGRSSTFSGHESDYQMTRAADGHWQIAAMRFLDRDGSSAPSLVPWYWEHWFLWTIVVELGLIAFFLAVTMAAEGTRPRERRSRGSAWSPSSMTGTSDGSLPHYW
jgi:hypothetical protein